MGAVIRHEVGFDPIPVAGCDCRACRVARCSPFERTHGFALDPLRGFGEPKVYKTAERVSWLPERADPTRGWLCVEWPCGCRCTWFRGWEPYHFHDGRLETLVACWDSSG